MVVKQVQSEARMSVRRTRGSDGDQGGPQGQGKSNSQKARIHTYNIAQTKAEGSGLALNGSSVPLAGSGRWRPKLRLGRALKTH